jgi:hypothetical protein
MLNTYDASPRPANLNELEEVRWMSGASVTGGVQGEEPVKQKDEAARLEEARRVEAELLRLVAQMDVAVAPLRAEIDQCHAHMDHVVTVIDALDREGSPFSRAADVDSLAGLASKALNVASTVMALHWCDVSDAPWKSLKSTVDELALAAARSEEDRRRAEAEE